MNRWFDRVCGGVRDAALVNGLYVQTGLLQRYLKVLAVGVVILFILVLLF